eukprot:Blabericola_migrator_1__2180@NODE_15_length_23605_cov_67_423868_g12_i0_p1_GENE_NODE_15_length_23605_cov_67_423868_g12_i0NODE_15_length_23605_cov_67_423868_g12_i0_p1_ORF_typecomplete_len1893_score261_16TRAPPC10/PF12584_8/5_3e03TRAPPC10/PF12584_8/0_00098_NODE_15_length_23605_cov_67_423868_g12_i022587936
MATSQPSATGLPPPGGFRVAYWDDQDLWGDLGSILTRNLPLASLGVQLPSSVVISSRSASIPGCPQMREVYIPKVNIVALPIQSPYIARRDVPASALTSQTPSPASPEPLVASSLRTSSESITTSPPQTGGSLSARKSPETPQDLMSGLTSGSNLLTWLDAGPDICAFSNGSDYPLCHLYLFTSDSIETYKANQRATIKKWFERMVELGDEFLILFVTHQAQEGTSETVLKAQKKVFDKIKTDLMTSLESTLAAAAAAPSSSAVRFTNRIRSVKDKLLRVPLCPLGETELNLPPLPSGWKSIPASDPQFAEMWETFLNMFAKSVAAGLSRRIQHEFTQKEAKQGAGATNKTARAKYTAVFEATERLAGSLVRCQMYPEALSVYDNLDLRMADQTTTARRYRTLFHNSGVPALGSSPIVFDIDRRGIRKLIQSDTISYVDFRQYLFARQAQVLYRMNRVDKLSVRSLAFMNALSFELLGFAHSPKDDPTNLREASVRTFLLLLSHNLMIRLLVLGLSQLQNLTNGIPSKEVLSDLLQTAQTMIGEQPSADDASNLMSAASSKFLSVKSTSMAKQQPVKKLDTQKRSLQSSLSAVSHLATLVLRNLWWLLKWRIADNWRSLTTVELPEDPPDCRTIWMRPITTFDLSRVLKDLGVGLVAEDCLCSHTMMYLDAIGACRQSLSILVQRHTVRWDMAKDAYPSTDVAPILDPTQPLPVEFALLCKESHINSVCEWLVRSLAKSPPDARLYPALLLAWLLLNKNVNSRLRHLMLTRHLKELEPFKEVIEQDEHGVCTLTLQGFCKIVSMMSAGSRRIAGSSVTSSTINLFRRKVFSGSKSFTGDESAKTTLVAPLPGPPNLHTYIGVRSLTRESVLIEPNEIEIGLDPAAFREDIRLETCFRTLGNYPYADTPGSTSIQDPAQLGVRGLRHLDSLPKTHAGDESSLSRGVSPRIGKETNAAASGVAGSSVVMFAEPLTIQLLIESDLCEPLSVRQIWIKILIENFALSGSKSPLIESPPLSKGGSRSKASSPVAMGEDCALWVCAFESKGDAPDDTKSQDVAVLRPKGMTLVEIPWNPTRSGRLTMSEIFIVPADVSRGFFLYQTLGSKECPSTMRRDARFQKVFYALNRDLKSLPAVAKRPDFTRQLLHLDVAPARSAFECEMATLSPKDNAIQQSLPLLMGRTNIVKLTINVSSHVQVTSTCKLAVHLKWFVKHRVEKDLFKNMKAVIIASHVVAIEIDGKASGLTKDEQGLSVINPTCRCIPIGGNHDWLGLPAFSTSIVILIPILLSTLNPDETSATRDAGVDSASPGSLQLPSPQGMRPVMRRLPLLRSEVQESNKTSDNASIESHSAPRRSSVPRLGKRPTIVFSPTFVPTQKEASVLVPRHVRSPSVRTTTHCIATRFLNTETNVFHPIVQDILPFGGKPAQLQVFVKLKGNVSPVGLDKPRSRNAFINVTRSVSNGFHEVIQIDTFTPLKTQAFLEKALSPTSRMAFPRLDDLHQEQHYLADHTTSTIFPVQTIFQCRFTRRPTNAGAVILNMQVLLSQGKSAMATPTRTGSESPGMQGSSPRMPIREALISSVDRTATMEEFIRAYRLDLCELEVVPITGPRGGTYSLRVLIDNGLYEIDTAQGKSLPMSAKDLQPCQLFNLGFIVIYKPETAGFENLSMEQWFNCPIEQFRVRVKYNMTQRGRRDESIHGVMDRFLESHTTEDCWFVMPPLEIPARPLPIQLVNINAPSVGLRGDIIKLDLIFQNYTKFTGYIRYNVVLPFDTDVEEERETLPPTETSTIGGLTTEKIGGSEARFWQLVGFKCTTVEFQPGKMTVISLSLVPTISGCLPLPPVKLVAWLGGSKKQPNQLAQISMQHCEQQISLQRIMVKSGGVQKLALSPMYGGLEA